ncbi:CbiX/SirB N-terminal domain-containing protein [Marivita sp. GX14005]|uniref:sirohydrochlorin chelatase n=1 Tax=Marivita sp. GX14005 TaxID=2942276 RepID=UPI0020197B59|nr:CbiX/SirB N-terminal domain-containing protein [Marivita sp. GX14005]MCL3882792.1 cobalamin biosynthesis protein CbiX [Marivita sp. GX14005]
MSFDAIIVSHGQPSDPETGEAEIKLLAEAVARHVPRARIEGVTLAAPGRMEEASAARPGAMIYPLFMADGWFTQVQLPKRLAPGAGPQLPSFGMDCTLPALAARWVREVAASNGRSPQETDLVIAGHGSGKSRRVSQATEAFADKVAADLNPRSIRCGYVEEEPSLESALTGLDETAICLPFFAARRGHVLDDLPEAVEAARFTGTVLDPIGLHPDVPKLIADALAWRATRQDA